MANEYTLVEFHSVLGFKSLLFIGLRAPVQNKAIGSSMMFSKLQLNCLSFEKLLCLCMMVWIDISPSLTEIPEDEARYWSSKLERINTMRIHDEVSMSKDCPVDNTEHVCC